MKKAIQCLSTLLLTFCSISTLNTSASAGASLRDEGYFRDLIKTNCPAVDGDSGGPLIAAYQDLNMNSMAVFFDR